MSGSFDTMCGKGGAACVACGADESCSPSSQPVCAPKLAATSLWQVQPSSAEIVPLDPADGLSWDADGSAPDVIVTMSCPTDGTPVNTVTPEVESLTPTWTTGGCTSTAGSLLKSALKVEVTDVDFAYDDRISLFSYTLTKADFDKGGVKLNLPEKTGTLTLSLTPRK